MKTKKSENAASSLLLVIDAHQQVTAVDELHEILASCRKIDHSLGSTFYYVTTNQFNKSMPFCLNLRITRWQIQEENGELRRVVNFHSKSRIKDDK